MVKEGKGGREMKGGRMWNCGEGRGNGKEGRKNNREVWVRKEGKREDGRRKIMLLIFAITRFASLSCHQPFVLFAHQLHRHTHCCMII
jgi:hypothetical protein